MMLVEKKLVPVRPPPSVSWDEVVTSLRGELAEYGGLMRLFDEQQKCIFASNAAAVADLVPEIEQQADAAKRCRNERERCVRDYAELRGRATDSSLRQLLPEFPVDVRPLLEALIDEINHMVQRTRQRNRQNQMLLGRLVELHHELVPAIRPQAFTKTYSRRGQWAVSTAGLGPSYRATG